MLESGVACLLSYNNVIYAFKTPLETFQNSGSERVSSCQMYTNWLLSIEQTKQALENWSNYTYHSNTRYLFVLGDYLIDYAFNKAFARGL